MEAVRDTLPDQEEIVTDADIIDSADIELRDDSTQYCWCCGYPSDDLTLMVLEDNKRKKHNCVICELCLDSPSILDGYLNPWLYSPDTRVILETIAYIGNRMIDEMRAVKNK